MRPVSHRRDGPSVATAAALAFCAIAGGVAFLDSDPADAGVAPLAPPVRPVPGPHVVVSHDWIEARPVRAPAALTGEAAGAAAPGPGRQVERCRNCLRIHLFPAVL